MAAKKKSKTGSNKPVVAKESDGSIQITFTIPFAKIKKAREEVALELGKNIEVPGFRKGKAPLEKVLEKVSPEKLIENTLSKILPKLFIKAVEENKLNLAVYPKYELISAEEGKNWQVRAKTAEINDFKLGNYKKLIKDKLSSSEIWTPSSAKATADKPGKDEKEPTQMEKEKKVMDTLLENIKVTTPKIMLEEEVSSRLSQLLERLEKLGLNLESYLASIGKNPDKLRKEYEKQAKESISLELILSKIAEEEKIKIGNDQIDAAIKASTADPKLAKDLDTPEKRRLIGSVLRKRTALSRLTSLI